MNRNDLQKWWSDVWSEGLWTASWSKSLEGLTAREAAWKPDPQRKSIWQIVHHMLFWREDALRRLKDSAAPSESDVARLNFLEPSEISDTAWRATVERFHKSQRDIAAALADEGTRLDRLPYLLPHDLYHMGQIMYLRAMLGKPPIE